MKIKIIAVAVYAACCIIANAEDRASSIASAHSNLDVRAKMAFGQALRPIDQSIFGGELLMRGYHGGIIIADKDGKTETITFKEKNPRQEPVGDISTFYHNQGGSKTFGQPQEGEHIIFGDRYRLHVFSKAVIVWRQDGKIVQAATFEANFK